MNRYMVARQRENCGPTQEIFVKTIDEARRAFDIAVSAGDVFAEIFDMDMNSQVMLHLAPSKHTVY
jgi:hypothetical protein